MIFVGGERLEIDMELFSVLWIFLEAGVHFETLTHTGHRHVRHIIPYE